MEKSKQKIYSRIMNKYFLINFNITEITQINNLYQNN